MHSITVEPTRNLVSVVLGGFLGEDDVAAYARDVAEALAPIPRERGPHLLLVDARALGIQSQDVVTAFERLANGSDRPARRIAVVVHATLTRSQARRALRWTDARTFEMPVPALEWLLG